MMTPGTKLGGRYRLDERIATGGMGDVWRATDEVLGREVAIKVLLPSLLNEAGFIERFRAEARVVATLTHPNVVRVYDYGESPLDGGGGVAYLVMEFIAGEALTARLQRRGKLSAEETLPIVAQAAEALHAAHEAGVIHRDVKPGNLLLTQNSKVMLTDFGIARSALTGGLTQAGSVMGTAAYVSPEQASGQPVSGQADVYSLGIVTYQCLAGHRPFDSDNPVELAMRHVNDPPPPLSEDIPAAAREFVDRALAKDLGQRFSSGAEMAEAARHAAGSASAESIPSGTTSSYPAAPPPAEDGAPRGAAVPPPGQGLDSNDTSMSPAVNPQTSPQMRQRNRLLLIGAITALAVVLLAGGAWAILGGGGSSSAEEGGDDKSSSQPAEDEGDTAEIDPDEFVNMTRPQAEKRLGELGFENVEFTGAGGFVAEVSPDGEQSLDTTITLKLSPTKVNPNGPGGDDSPSGPGGSGGPSDGSEGPDSDCEGGLGCPVGSGAS